MKYLWNSSLFLLLWITSCIQAQSSFYRHDFYHPITTRYYQRNNGFVPITYSRDLVPEESKRKISSKKYSKSVSRRPALFTPEEDDFSNEHFSSGEYSNESRGFDSREQDNREYTIGTQIHVQHPITIPKKQTSSHPPKVSKHKGHLPSISSSNFGSDINFSEEIRSPEIHSSLPHKKHPPKYSPSYEPDPFHVIPPPKTTSPAITASSSVGYNVYETDLDDYKPPKKSRDRYKSVASKKQIERYLDDQQKKLLDEALKIQLLNNPEFKQFLKAKEKQRIEKEQQETYNDEEAIMSPPQPPPSVFLDNLEESITFTTLRPQRRPTEFKRPPKRKVSTIRPKRKFRSAILIDV